MTVEDVRLFVNYIANKHQTGKTFTPDQYNAALPRAVDDFVRQRYGLPQDYKPGQSIPQMGWEVTQNIADDLKSLKIDPITITIDANGKYTYPTDYMHHGALRHEFIQNDDCIYIFGGWIATLLLVYGLWLGRSWAWALRLILSLIGLVVLWPNIFMIIPTSYIRTYTIAYVGHFIAIIIYLLIII